jgi:hypothetical protein
MLRGSTCPSDMAECLLTGFARPKLGEPKKVSFRNRPAEDMLSGDEPPTYRLRISCFSLIGKSNRQSEPFLENDLTQMR